LRASVLGPVDFLRKVIVFQLVIKKRQFIKILFIRWLGHFWVKCPHGLAHLRANTDNIDPILPLGIILPQMNANQRKWGDIDSPLSTVPDRFAFIGVDLRLNLL